jgi:3-oxoacyl-[acyl-carrier protein] reductase
MGAGMSGLAGKVALVTGGGRGIGAAIVRRLAEDGAAVALTYARSADRATAVADRIEAGGGRALVIEADHENPDAAAGAVQRVAGAWGRLDILVNNAATFAAGPIGDVTVEDLDRVLAVNVRSVFLASQAAARTMTGGGRIISIGTCLTRRLPGPGLALFTMSKAALTGLTKGLARDLGPRGITANLVQPGPIDTESNPQDGPGADARRSATALGAYGRPDDIAATVAHLAGDGGRYITGATVAVDGGFAI